MLEEYFYPATLDQATSIFSVKKREGYFPGYFAGGTEIITLGRLNQSEVNIAIDIKQIPSCNIYQLNEDYLVIGSAISLTDIVEKNYFPLLSEICREIADKTARNKITVGGNICGEIFYREAVLPLLLTNSVFVVSSESEMRTEFLMQMFHKKLALRDGELFVQSFIEKKYLKQPYVAIKVRQQWDTGYPLITAAALKMNEEVRVAFSGLCPFPFRSLEIERVLNDSSHSKSDRIKWAIEKIPGPILDDVEGTSDYRLFMFENILENILGQLEVL